MQHLEEGTIHAWLDGALDEAEGARVARHAAECESCAAMVAEARGFIAGASRIVSALDVVRGGVIPPSGTGAPSRDQLAGRRRSLWTTLHFTPVRAAIAATVLVAVGSMLTVRQDKKVEIQSRAASPAAAPSHGPAVLDSTASVSPRREVAGERRQAAAVASGSGRLKESTPSALVLEKQAAVTTRTQESSPIEAAKVRAAQANAPASGASAPAPVPAPSAPPPAAVGRVAGVVDAAAARDQRAAADTTANRLRDSVALARRPDATRTLAATVAFRLRDSAAQVRRADSLRAPARVVSEQTRSNFLSKADVSADSASAAEGCYTVAGTIPPWAAALPRSFALDRAVTADSTPDRRVVRGVNGGRAEAAIARASWHLRGDAGVEVTWASGTGVTSLTFQPNRAPAPIVATIGDGAHVEAITISRGSCSPR